MRGGSLFSAGELVILSCLLLSLLLLWGYLGLDHQIVMP